MDYQAAEYKGRKVTLNKPFRTQGGKKKFAVYVQKPGGRVVIVRFGDPNMEIKRDDPKRRKAFRDRHSCSEKKDRTTPGYWSCQQWRKSAPVQGEELDMDNNESWELNEVQAIFEDIEEIIEAEEEPCGDEGDCGCGCDKTVEAQNPAAPKKDRIKGSPKNKKDSAKNKSGKITFSDSVTKSLSTKAKEHNESSDKKVSLGMLKSVYRRGAGAYSTSHRTGISRAAWSMARVNAFLKLVRSGKPSNPKYVQDNDLLPKNHARASEDEEEDEYKAVSDVFDNPAEAMKRAKEMGCDEVHSHTEDGKTVFMPCKSHSEYKNKNGGVDVEGYYHKKKIEAEGTCWEGYKQDGMKKKGDKMVPNCVRVAVTTDLTVKSVETVLEASSGKSMIMISGVAFHEGMNKNSWEITKVGAEKLLPQMIGADITLNHPKATNGKFRRNMTGLDEGVVGRITSATMEDKEGDSWEVRFTGSVERSELFEVLESGLWLREGYGVSIGGTGVPDKVVEAADGRQGMVFESDFNFDHLAIVHKPAYTRAVIDEAVRVESTAPSASQDTPHLDKSSEIEATFIPTSPQSEDYGTGLEMTDEEIIEPVAEELVASEDLSLKMAELEKALIMANSRVAEFEEIEDSRAESARLELVASATEMGLKGHEALPAETIKELIASWADSKPIAREMKPVEPASSPTTATASTAVVANYLNGRIVESPEASYAASFNSLVAAYNRGSATEGRAPTFEEAKNKGLI